MKNLLQNRLAVGMAFLLVVALSGCGGGNKDNQATDTTSPGTDTTATSPNTSTNSSPVATTSPLAGTGTGTTTTSTPGVTPSASGVLSAQAKSLGVTPTGTTCPTNAPVKGKATKKRGDIYHLPKTPDYSKVKPDICFKDAATAQQAGFRAPKGR